MDHALIIDALGGYEAVSRRLGRHRTRAHKWKTKGIPPLVWPEISRMAREAGRPDISIEALEMGYRSKRVVAPPVPGAPAAGAA